jgi:hypothetical protein
MYPPPLHAAKRHAAGSGPNPGDPPLVPVPLPDIQPAHPPAPPGPSPGLPLLFTHTSPPGPRIIVCRPFNTTQTDDPPHRPAKASIAPSRSPCTSADVVPNIRAASPG